MNVLSLFDGKAGAYAALKLAGFQIDKYFASEVDPYPMKIAKKNFPDIIHIGDVKGIFVNEFWGDCKDDDLITGEKYTHINKNLKIDLLIGGSPCQDLSIAKKNGKGLEGEKSSLFFEYARILSAVRPKYFILENVASMKAEERDKMTKTIMEIYPDAELHMINSALVTAQNRKRYYWTNIKGVTQPEDRKIFLRDILEEIPMDDERWEELPDKYITDEGRVRINEATKIGYIEPEEWDVVDMQHPGSKTRRGRLMKSEGKSNTLYTGDRMMVIGRIRGKDDLRIHAEQDKCPTLTSHLGTGGNNVPIMLGIHQLARGKNSGGIVANGEKAPTITTGLYEHNNKLMAYMNDRYFYRKLTCIECERLQGYEDNYTEGVSASRRYAMIGNGFNKPTVAHIASFIPKE